MTLILLLLALITSPHAVTIHPTHSPKEQTMAQGNPGPPGNGSNNQNRRTARISYPTRHPNAGPGHGPGTTYNRIGREASNPTTFTEHTQRPQPR